MADAVWDLNASPPGSRLDEVERLVGGLQGGAPAGFVGVLFSRVAPEDLDLYPATALATLADAAWRHLAERRTAGLDEVRLSDAEVEVAGRLRELTVLEILNDNMPFLLDSTLAELTERGLEIRFVAHPRLAVERDATGALRRLAGEAVGSSLPGTRRESLIHVHLERIDDPARRAELLDALHKVYADVRIAVQDWPRMRARLSEVLHAYKSNPPPLDADEVAEAVSFLNWLADDNFTLLGLREYRIPEEDIAADPVEGSGLGILSDPAVKVLRRGRELVTMTPEIRAFLQEPVPLLVTKASVKSRVHRRVHMDYVGVKLFSQDGLLQGELRIVGLFTASAYTDTTDSVPFIKHKVARVIRRAGFDAASYSGRALRNVLENYPRDELFQVDIDTLLAFSLDIMRLYERPRVRVLARPDRFDRFVSVLVYVPKDRYDTGVRLKVGELLARLYKGRFSAAYPAYPEGPLARTHYIIGRDEGETPRLDRATLEGAVNRVVRTWADGLAEALAAAQDGARARSLATRYREAFSAAYREAFSPEQGVADIGIMERLGSAFRHSVRVERREGSDDEGRVNLVVFALGRAMALSDRVPALENMGFRVVNERT